MKRHIPGLAELLFCIFGMTVPLTAQTSVLYESFESGTWSPGWTIQRLNATSTVNWSIHGTQNYTPAWCFGLYCAKHDYGLYGTTDDNVLVSPPMSLTGLTQAWLHYYEAVEFPSFRENHWIDVSLDGVTWNHVYNSITNQQEALLNVDLSAYRGLAGVYLGFHYKSTDGAVWFVDEVLVNDNSATPPPPPIVWNVNLPTTFADARNFVEDFDGGAGTLRPYMAVTELSVPALAPDAMAWANVGQHGPTTGGQSGNLPFNGSYCLELGLQPYTSNYHDVRTALVFALDGKGRDGLQLSFQVADQGEEKNSIDGVWVSADGRSWRRAHGYWTPYGTTWKASKPLDLSKTMVPTTRKFYLMFAQEDNFPLGNKDGVQIDDIKIKVPPQIRVSNFVSGFKMTLELQDYSPGGRALVAWSFAGPGPTTIFPYGDLLVSNPYSYFEAQIDATGTFFTVYQVPPNKTGDDVWMHSLDYLSGVFSNPLAFTAQ